MGRESAITALVGLAVLVVLGTPPATAQALQVAPRSPEFLAYLDAVAAGTQSGTGATGFGLGYIPSPVDHRYTLVPGVPTRPLLGAPTSYDLRNTTDKVPPVRDQGSCGSCWTFSTCASLETCARPGDLLLDGSENHMKNTHGFVKTCCAGGNASMSTAYLARWAGPVSEASDPYAISCTSPDGLTTQRHVQHAWFLPVRTSSTDNATIKDAIMNYGGVHTAVYVMGGVLAAPYWNSATASLYYNGAEDSTDHAVTIIGWDDNYSRDNFYSTNKPTNNGAFLIRNSWGDWGVLHGYFWVSYEDKFVGNIENALFFSAEATSNYATVYQYDPLGWVNDAGYSVTTMWLANRFTKGATQEQLAAVSFYTNDANASYQVYCYKNPSTGGPITGGTSMLPAPGYVTGTFTYEGFHTVTLPEVADLNLATDDSSFSVVVRLENTTYGRPGCLECDADGYADASAVSGRSFYSINGTSWGDLYTDLDSSADWCIKAYTYPGPLMVGVLDFRAHEQGAGVLLTWRTANEVETAGFHICRSQSPAGPFERLTGAMLTAKGEGSKGAEYRFVDREARAGRTYFYRLQEVTESGLTRDCSETVSATARESALYDLLPYGVRLLLAS